MTRSGTISAIIVLPANPPNFAANSTPATTQYGSCGCDKNNKSYTTVVGTGARWKHSNYKRRDMRTSDEPPYPGTPKNQWIHLCKFTATNTIHQQQQQKCAICHTPIVSGPSTGDISRNSSTCGFFFSLQEP